MLAIMRAPDQNSATLLERLCSQMYLLISMGLQSVGRTLAVLFGAMFATLQVNLLFSPSFLSADLGFIPSSMCFLLHIWHTSCALLAFVKVSKLQILMERLTF